MVYFESEMKTLACCGVAGCSCGVRSIVGTGSIVGVGDWSGFFSGVGNFIASDLGKAIITVGTTIGGAYLSKELLGSGNRSSGQQGSMTSNGYVNPAGSGFIPQASATGSTGQQPIIIQQSAMPEWMLPLGLGAVAFVVLFAMRGRRR